MSFQRAQGKIDTFYPHCYSLGRWNDMLLIKFPWVKPRLFHLYVFTYKIDLGLALENEEEFRDGE